MNVLEFLEAILTLRVRFAFSVTSWIRTYQRNNIVNGRPGSWHIYGLAVDVVPDSNLDKVDFVPAAEKLGLSVLDEKDHWHIQPKFK